MSIRSIGGERVEDATGYAAEIVDDAIGMIVIGFSKEGARWRFFGDVQLGAFALFLTQMQAQVAREAEEVVP